MKDFNQLTSDYFDGTLDDKQLEDLARLIQQDPHNAREFMRAAHLHNGLHALITAASENEDSGNLGDAHILPAIHDAEASPARSAPQPLKHVVYPSRRQPEAPAAAPPPASFARHHWLAAAALLIPLFAIALWYSRSQPQPPAPAKIALTTAPVAPPVTVATLARVIDCQWQSTPLGIGQRLPLDVYELHAGYALLKFDSGASVILHGPAKFTLDSPTRMHLLLGSLTTDVPPAAKGFAVDIPSASVVDLGTEIGVAVDPAQNSHVEVFKGLAEVQLASTTSSARRLTPANAVSIDATRNTIAEAPALPLAFTRASQLDDVAKTAEAAARWEACAQKIRLDPSLIAYYSFAGPFQSPDKLQNLVAPGPFDGQLQNAAWDLGRFPNHASLRFNGNDSRVPINITQACQSLTFAAWVNLAHFTRNNASILMSDGAHERPTLCHIQFSQVGARPAIEFGTPAGAGWNNYYFHSNDIPFTVGQWTFIAIAYNPSAGTISCWLNNKCIATHPIPRSSSAILFGSAQIGNWNGSRPEDNRAFDGRIEEIALWNHPLSPDEIQSIYQAGMPPALSQ